MKNRGLPMGGRALVLLDVARLDVLVVRDTEAQAVLLEGALGVEADQLVLDDLGLGLVQHKGVGLVGREHRPRAQRPVLARRARKVVRLCRVCDVCVSNTPSTDHGWC